MDSVVYEGVCGCRCGELIWTCPVWAERSTLGNFGMLSRWLNSATGEQKNHSDHYTDPGRAGQSIPKLISANNQDKKRKHPTFYVFGVTRSGIELRPPAPQRTL